MVNRKGTHLVFPLLGGASFAVSAVFLIAFQSSAAGIDIHPIHIDSLFYMCHGLQLGPLNPQVANVVAASTSELSGQVTLDCFEPDGSPALLLRTYYPRLAIAMVVALASVTASAYAILAIPVVVMGALGLVWGTIVALPPRRALWLKIVALFLPLLSVANVLWLGSLMTEGLFTFVLLVAVVMIYRRDEREVGTSTFIIWMLLLGLVLLITRTTWPLVGILWGIGISEFLRELWRRGSGKPLSRLLRSAILSVSIAVSAGLAWVLNRLLESLVVPDVTFPPSNEPPESIPTSLPDLLLVLNVSWRSVVTGLGQSIALFDFGTTLLAILMPVLLVLIMLRASVNLRILVIGTWALSLVIVGLVSLCCGGLNSYFRYLIPSIMVTLAVAWLSRTSRRKALIQRGDAPSSVRPMGSRASDVSASMHRRDA